MVSTFSLISSFIRKKNFFLMKLEMSETPKLSTIPVLPIMSLFNQFSTRSDLHGVRFTNCKELLSVLAHFPWRTAHSRPSNTLDFFMDCQKIKKENRKRNGEAFGTERIIHRHATYQTSVHVAMDRWSVDLQPAAFRYLPGGAEADGREEKERRSAPESENAVTLAHAM